MVRQIEDLISGRNESHKHASHSTTFKEIPDGDLPPEEKTITRMQHESQGMVGARIHTVEWTVSVATVYVLATLLYSSS